MRGVETKVLDQALARQRHRRGLVESAAENTL